MPVIRTRYQPAPDYRHRKTIAGLGGLTARRAHHRRSAAFHAKPVPYRQGLAAPPARHHQATLNPRAARKTAPASRLSRQHRVIAAGRATVTGTSPALTSGPWPLRRDGLDRATPYRSRKDHHPDATAVAGPSVPADPVGQGDCRLCRQPDTELANMRITSNARARYSSRSYSAICAGRRPPPGRSSHAS